MSKGDSKAGIHPNHFVLSSPLKYFQSQFGRNNSAILIKSDDTEISHLREIPEISLLQLQHILALDADNHALQIVFFTA